MIEIFPQIRNNCPICKGNFGTYYIPVSDEDREKSKEHKLFQRVRAKIYGTQKERSLKQIDLYWASCEFVSNNTEHKQWNTKSKVDFQCRVAIHLVDKDVVCVNTDGSVQFSYRSIAFKNLKHIYACDYFNQAFGVMTDFLNTTYEKKITVDQLIEKVKANMGN